MKKVLIVATDLEDFVEVLETAGVEVEIAGSNTEVGTSLDGFDAVVLRPMAGDVRLSALVRRRIRTMSSQTQERLCVGLCFNMKRSQNGAEHEAEFDAPRTIDALEAAIASHGFEVQRMEADADFPALLESVEPDFVFNIAEGWH